MIPKLRMVQANHRLTPEGLIQYVAAHHLPDADQDVLQIAQKLLALAHLRENRLIENKQRLQAVQLSAEQDPVVVLVHQHIPVKLRHMLGLLVVKRPCGVVHIPGLRLALVFLLSRRRRFGNSRHLCGCHLQRLLRTRLFIFLDDFNLALLQILSRRRRKDLSLRNHIDLRSVSS